MELLDVFNRKVTEDDIKNWKSLIGDGYTLREIGKKYNREHRVILYHTSDLYHTIRLNQTRKSQKPRVDTLHRVLTESANRCRSRSRQYEIPIDIPFSFDKPSNNLINPYSISVDRIEPSKGYVRGNVRLLLSIVNRMRSNFSDELLIKVCKAISENNK